MSRELPLYGFGPGGGSAGGNFKLVGGEAQPSGPAENTIWVNTSEKITSYLFSPQEPEAPEAGMVWIRTGDRSTGAFFATKGGTVRLYPAAVRQYVGDQWVEKTGYIYQSGSWILWWSGQLYSPGIEWEEVTGGWTGLGMLASNKSSESAIAPAITRESGRIIADGTAGGGIIYCAEKIDLTDYTTLIFEGVFTRAGTLARNVLAACWSVLGKYYTDAAASKEISGTSATVLQVDVSGLTGEYYVGIGLTASTAEITACYLR